VTISQNTWQKIKLDPIALFPGANRLRWLVTSGVVSLDWIELSPVEKGQPAAQ